MSEEQPKTPAQIADEEAKRKKQERMAAARAAKAAKLSKPPIKSTHQSDGEQAVAKPASEDNAPHPDYPDLTRAQVAAARERARATAEKARIKALMEKVEKDETERLKLEEGINGKERMVEVVLNMPDVAYRPGPGQPKPWIQINLKRYYGGQSYTVTESLAKDLLYIAYRMRANESARLGEDAFSFYQKQQAPAISYKTGAVIPGGGIPMPDLTGR